jgi:hypothetical protein
MRISSLQIQYLHVAIHLFRPSLIRPPSSLLSLFLSPSCPIHFEVPRHSYHVFYVCSTIHNADYARCTSPYHLSLRRADLLLATRTSILQHVFFLFKQRYPIRLSHHPDTRAFILVRSLCVLCVNVLSFPYSTAVRIRVLHTYLSFDILRISFGPQSVAALSTSSTTKCVG